MVNDAEVCALRMCRLEELERSVDTAANACDVSGVGNLKTVVRRVSEVSEAKFGVERGGEGLEKRHRG